MAGSGVVSITTVFIYVCAVISSSRAVPVASRKNNVYPVGRSSPCYPGQKSAEDMCGRLSDLLKHTPGGSTSNPLAPGSPSQTGGRSNKDNAMSICQSFQVYVSCLKKNRLLEKCLSAEELHVHVQLSVLCATRKQAEEDVTIPDTLVNMVTPENNAGRSGVPSIANSLPLDVLTLCSSVMLLVQNIRRLDDANNRLCPIDLSHIETKCHYKTLLDLTYPPSSRKPTEGSNWNNSEKSDGKRDRTLNMEYIELSCLTFENFDSCLQNYLVPESCLSPGAWQLYVVLSFICGEGKQGFVKHASDLSSCTNGWHCTENKADDIIINIATVSNIHMNMTSVAHAILRQTYSSLYCHMYTRSYQDCLIQSYKACGNESMMWIKSLLNFVFGKMVELVKPWAVKYQSIVSCDDFTHQKSDDGNSTATNDTVANGSDRWLGVITQVAPMTDMCLKTLPTMVSTFAQLFGPCHTMTQWLRSTICLCGTMQKLKSRLHTIAMIPSFLEVVDEVCDRYIGEFTKCNADQVTVCEQGVSRYIQDVTTSYCMATAEAVLDLKCKEDLPNILATLVKSCDSGRMLVDGMAVNQGTPSMDAINGVVEEFTCLTREGVITVNTLVKPVCGQSVAINLVNCFQAAGSLIQESRDAVNSVYQMMGE